VKISEAKQHDKNFLKHLILPPGSMIAFDKAYNHYLQFTKWTQEGVFFVCRLKDNAKYEVQDVMFEQTLPENGISLITNRLFHKFAKLGVSLYFCSFL
jgi:hypothetical protein